MPRVFALALNSLNANRPTNDGVLTKENSILFH